MQDTYTYHLLNKITDLFEKYRGKIDNVFILACQHILDPQAKMFQLISNFGIPKENIMIFGKIYSTSNEVLDDLLQDGFKVSKPVFDPTKSFDIEHRENCEKEFDRFIEIVHPHSKIIILDDGGELLKFVNEKFKLLPAKTAIVGIEQTSSGFRKLENTFLNFPVFNVARSVVKLTKESPLIASLGCQRIIDVINQYSISQPRILVVGLGPIGSNTLSILNSKGYFAIGYDIAHQNKTELTELIDQNKINIVVGATGTNILNKEQLQSIANIVDYNLYLISMSSADREFPTTYIRQNGVISKKIHGDVVWNNLILINNGFPITFKGQRYESTPEEIERTIGLLYGSTLEAIFNNEDLNNGFMDVPEKITTILEDIE